MKGAAQRGCGGAKRRAPLRAPRRCARLSSAVEVVRMVTSGAARDPRMSDADPLLVACETALEAAAGAAWNWSRTRGVGDCSTCSSCRPRWRARESSECSADVMQREVCEKGCAGLLPRHEPYCAAALVTTPQGAGYRAKVRCSRRAPRGRAQRSVTTLLLLLDLCEPLWAPWPSSGSL